MDMAAQGAPAARLQGRLALRLPLGRRAGRGRPLPARDQHPAGHDPAQPGARAGRATAASNMANWSSGSSPRRWPKPPDERRARPPRRRLRAKPAQEPRPRWRCRRRSPTGCRSARRAPTSSPAWPSPASCWRSAWSCWSRSISRPRPSAPPGSRSADAGFTRQRLSDQRHPQHGPRADRRRGQRRTEPRRGRRRRRAAVAGAGRCRRDPPPAAALWLGQGRARAPPAARYAGHRHRRAHARRRCGRTRGSWR